MKMKSALMSKDLIMLARETIAKEQCDEFVLVAETIAPIHTFCSYLKAKELYRKLKRDKITFAIYGAIWTEWGLQYIAKMNDKLELELL